MKGQEPRHAGLTHPHPERGAGPRGGRVSLSGYQTQPDSPPSPPQHYLLAPPAPSHRIDGSSPPPEKGEPAGASFRSQTQPQEL